MPSIKEFTPAYLQQSTESIQKAVPVSPSDAADLTHVTRALFIGVAGDVRVDFEGAGTGILLKNLAAGMWHPMQITRVYATGTSAIEIVAGR